MDDVYEDDWEEGPSKSELKRRMTELQQLGEKLTQLTPVQLAKVAITDQRLIEAIDQAKRINARGGKRRQLQYIGKLMRDIDADPIRQAIKDLEQGNQAENQRFHRLENLRDILLTRGDAGLESVIEQLPGADRQHLRQLLRKHQREVSEGKPQATARKIFRYLRALDDSESLDSSADNDDSPDTLDSSDSTG